MIFYKKDNAGLFATNESDISVILYVQLVEPKV